jgi:hypothetical protein
MRHSAQKTTSMTMPPQNTTISILMIHANAFTRVTLCF